MPRLATSHLSSEPRPHRRARRALRLLRHRGIDRPGRKGRGRRRQDHLTAVRSTPLVENGAVKSLDVAGGMGQVMDYGHTFRWAPGNLRSAHGQGRDSIEARTTRRPDVFEHGPVVRGPCLFTMKKSDTDQYHVYWAGLAPTDDGKSRSAS